MTDVVDRATRSRMMSGIRGKDTKPEITVRKYLHASGFRYRVAPSYLPGRPDIVLPKYRLVILVHGCFWHRHPGCRYAATPSSNQQFWQAKFTDNIARDRRVVRDLEALGWRVTVVWGCSIGSAPLKRLAKEIRHRKEYGTSE